MERGIGRLSWSRLPVRLTLLVMLLGFESCGRVELQSRFRDRVITIDGQADEWRDSTTLVKAANVSLGLFNDDHDLYVCITSWNEEFNHQATDLGLTLWFDPDGGDRRQFGIEYPLMEDAIGSKEAGGGARGGSRGGGRGGGMGGRRRGGSGGGTRRSGSDGGDTSAGSPRMPRPLRLTVKVRLAALQ